MSSLRNVDESEKQQVLNKIQDLVLENILQEESSNTIERKHLIEPTGKESVGSLEPNKKWSKSLMDVLETKPERSMFWRPVAKLGPASGVDPQLMCLERDNQSLEVKLNTRPGIKLLDKNCKYFFFYFVIYLVSK